MDTFSYYFTKTFPLKLPCVKDSIVNKWITKGTNTSSNKLRLLHNIKISMNLPMESLKHIQNYQLIFWKVIKEAKWAEVDRLSLSAKNKNKALWNIINEETANFQQLSNITINSGGKIITNPKITAERLNIYFTEVTEGFLSQVNFHCPQQHLNFQIKNCSETMFIAPVTVTEVEQVIKILRTIHLLALTKSQHFSETMLMLLHKATGSHL